MKTPLLVLNLLFFVIELLHPTSRFVRVGALVKPRKSFFYSTINKAPKVKHTKALVAKTDDHKRQDANADTTPKKPASHKAAPRSQPSAPIAMAFPLERTIDSVELLSRPPDDILQPPIFA
jgi:hypothetical protein